MSFHADRILPHVLHASMDQARRSGSNRWNTGTSRARLSSAATFIAGL